MNPDSIAVIRGRNEDMLKEQRLAQRHLEQMAIAGDIEKSVYTAVETITRFFSLYTGKTEVLNPVTSVATPDIVQVVKSVQDLGEIVKLSRTDLTPILSELSKVLQQLEALPKELPKLEVEKTEEVKVSNLADIKEFDYKRLEKLIKGLDFKQPAPVVNVPQANVQVDAPNLEPIKKSLLDVIKAVKANKVEVPKTDLSKVEKLLEKNNKLQAEILDKPIGGGGGGGGNGSPYTDSTGTTKNVILTADGSIPVTVKNSLTPNVDFDYIDIQQTSATVETYVYKQGGVSGTTVQTITVTYTDSTKNDLDKVEYS